MESLTIFNLSVVSFAYDTLILHLVDDSSAIEEYCRILKTRFGIPSGKHLHNYGKSPFLVVMFNRKLLNYQKVFSSFLSPCLC